MNRRRNIRDHIWLALAVLSLVLMVFAVATPRAVGDTDSAARKVERRLSGLVCPASPAEAAGRHGHICV